MSLDYSTKGISDDPTLVNDEGYWIPEFQSIVFATMNVGINELSEKNVGEFYRRYLMSCYALDFKPFFDLELLTKFAGLKTNASTKTITAFNKDILGAISDRAQRTIHNEAEAKRIEGN